MALDYTNYCGSGSGSKPGGTTVLGMNALYRTGHLNEQICLLWTSSLSSATSWSASSSSSRGRHHDHHLPWSSTPCNHVCGGFLKWVTPSYHPFYFRMVHEILTLQPLGPMTSWKAPDHHIHSTDMLLKLAWFLARNLFHPLVYQSGSSFPHESKHFGDMGGSWIGGTPKWMVYNGKSICKWMI